MTRDEEVEGIVAALDSLLTAAFDEERRSAGDAPVEMSVGQIVAEITDVETELQGLARSLIRNPVGEALRDAMTVLGERLDEIGGVGAMGKALDAVCVIRPEHDAWRENFLDRLWSGIGEWLA